MSPVRSYRKSLREKPASTYRTQEYAARCPSPRPASSASEPLRKRYPRQVALGGDNRQAVFSMSDKRRYCYRSVIRQTLWQQRLGRGTAVQLLLSYRFSYWHRHCLFSERIWVATGHTGREPRCQRQHFRTGAIAPRIACFDCWVHFFDGAYAF